MKTFFRKSYEVVGFTYEADVHCVDCTRKAYGSRVADEGWSDQDSEGNVVYPIFLDQLEQLEHCGTCLAEIS